MKFESVNEFSLGKKKLEPHEQTQLISNQAGELKDAVAHHTLFGFVNSGSMLAAFATLLAASALTLNLKSTAALTVGAAIVGDYFFKRFIITDHAFDSAALCEEAITQAIKDTTVLRFM